jgi:hypothetical protein
MLWKKILKDIVYKLAKIANSYIFNLSLNSENLINRKCSDKNQVKNSFL